MKILLNFRAFPIAMGRWFEFALKDLGHQVIVAGPTMGDEVPWPNGPHHFPKYNFPPDIRLPDWPEYPLSEVVKKMGSKPDLVIQAGDTCFLSGPAPDGVKNIIIATDPHCIDYRPRLTYASRFVCMQNYYGMQYNRAFVYCPYAYYPGIHKNIPGSEKKYDVVFCGLPYAPREEFVEKARDKNLKVYSGLGTLYEEYCQLYNEGTIAFNCSSRLDVPARFWEGLAMGNLVLTNWVPELETIEHRYKISNEFHYVSYTTIDEAVEKAVYYSKHPVEASRIALRGMRAVQEHTYINRVRKLEKLWTS